MTSAAFGDMIVAYRNGSPVRLKALGRVIDGVQNDKAANTLYTNRGAERSIGLAVQRQPGTNTVEVVDRVKALLPRFARMMPPSVQLDISDGPLRADSRFGQRREVHAGAGHGAGGAGDFSVPAQRLGHRDSQPGAAHLGDRHFRRDVRCWATRSTTCR